MAENRIAWDLALSRFRRLLGELRSGAIRRNHFAPWELEILLDVGDCRIKPRRHAGTLLQYAKAVERQLEAGHGPPVKLSEFLARRRGKLASIASPESHGGPQFGSGR